MGICGKLLQIIVAGFVIIFAIVAAATASTVAKPGCLSRCGDVEIPYPFGMTEDCYLDENFNITCDSGIPKVGAVTVTNISIETHELHVLNFVANDSYLPGGVRINGYYASLWTAQFTISNSKNKFIVIGCDTYAYLSGYQNGELYTIGCSSQCPSLRNVIDGSCSGVGCCELEFPDGLKDIDVVVTSFHNYTNISDFNSCGYAFVVEKGEFNFSSSYLKAGLPSMQVPLVLDWVAGNETCEEAHKKPSFACQDKNSECLDDLQTSWQGYRCKCKQGYQGNPYLDGGCKGIIHIYKASLI
jgi:hypothetical protein